MDRFPRRADRPFFMRNSITSAELRDRVDRPYVMGHNAVSDASCARVVSGWMVRDGVRQRGKRRFSDRSFLIKIETRLARDVLRIRRFPRVLLPEGKREEGAFFSRLNVGCYMSCSRPVKRRAGPCVDDDSMSYVSSDCSAVPPNAGAASSRCIFCVGRQLGA